MSKTGKPVYVMDLIKRLREAGHLNIGEKDAVTYADPGRDMEKL